MARLKRKSPLRRWGPRRGKFGAVPKSYGGREYHSTKEARYAETLDQLRHAMHPRDRVAEWRPQVPVKLEVNGKLVTTYICDFLVTFGDGRQEWHEVKGFETETWKIKEKLFRALVPDRRLVVVK